MVSTLLLFLPSCYQHHPPSCLVKKKMWGFTSKQEPPSWHISLSPSLLTETIPHLSNRSFSSSSVTSRCSPVGGYKLPVTFLATAQAGNSVRLKRGTPQVVMANITTATPIRFTPNPAFTMSLICTWP